MLKNIALVLLLLVSVAFGSLWVRERQQTHVASERVVILEKQTSAQQSELRAVKTAVAEQEQKQQQAAADAKAERQARRAAREAAIATATADTVATPGPAAADTPAPPAAAAKPKGLAGLFNGNLSKMMKDPAMKNMMRTAQSTMLKQVYSDFVKQHGFSPQETDAFYEALLDKQAADMDKGMKMMDKGFDPAAAAADSGEADAKLKATLGDDVYAQYKEYEKTLPGRLTVSQYQQQLAATNTSPLTTEQSRAVLQAINDEKLNFPETMKNAMNAGDTSFMTDPAKMDAYMKAQGDLNAKIDARVEYLLTPEQLKVLKDQQQQTLAMQRMGMEMAARMMATPASTP